MTKLNATVQARFEQYPKRIESKMKALRKLIFDVAQKNGLSITESLKWGEPSFHVKGGSPIRIDWKEKSPSHYYLFFNCQTKLVATFIELYGDSLGFEGNRAIAIDVNKPLDKKAIAHCVDLAFHYHGRKHLPLLGA